MGNSKNIKMGTCAIAFGGADLGYTKGAVSVDYSTSSVEIEVDQENAPIDEIITKQTCEVKVPMAEYDLSRFATLMPGATLITDGEKMRLDLSGKGGGSLKASAKTLTLAPVDGGSNDAFTMQHAVPLPNISFSFEKEGQRVYEITFKALGGDNGFITFGDTTATIAA